RRHHGMGRRPPGALEINECAVLVEQNGADRHYRFSKVPVPDDPSCRADATVLTRGEHTGLRGLRAAAAGLAGACLFDATAPAQLPRLGPAIPADSPVIPLPRPRPAIPLPGEVAEPAGPTECQLRMTADIAVIEPLPHIAGANGCGIDDPVRLSAVMTKDK